MYPPPPHPTRHNRHRHRHRSRCSTNPSIHKGHPEAHCNLGICGPLPLGSDDHRLSLVFDHHPSTVMDGCARTRFVRLHRHHIITNTVMTMMAAKMIRVQWRSGGGSSPPSNCVRSASELDFTWVVLLGRE
ncbi:hypothetical protein PGTUg99_015722 [Puccinia graminis f. sp. tritici]|uniref:Uncharacterized protein n=1 Tax=Puccinia graminis f. sp. tritici TaxID=56615 RepID=A0A5B0R973_PUCGR|nr:hypothetical protein PGTUg99_015722 [Puccinia graminis f. sp. tritici]